MTKGKSNQDGRYEKFGIKKDLVKTALIDDKNYKEVSNFNFSYQ